MHRGSRSTHMHGVRVLEGLSSRQCQTFTRYLDDPAHRETFEAAHSCILAIFSWHARQALHGEAVNLCERVTSRLIPFYTQCLLEVRFVQQSLVELLTCTCNIEFERG